MEWPRNGLEVHPFVAIPLLFFPDIRPRTYDKTEDTVKWRDEQSYVEWMPGHKTTDSCYSIRHDGGLVGEWTNAVDALKALRSKTYLNLSNARVVLLVKETVTLTNLREEDVNEGAFILSKVL